MVVWMIVTREVVSRRSVKDHQDGDAGACMGFRGSR